MTEKEYMMSNLYNIPDFKITLNSDYKKYTLHEYKTWAEATPEILSEFYINNQNPLAIKDSKFWSFAHIDENIHKVHIPVAEKITKNMASLLFNKMPKYLVLSGNKENDKKLNKIIEEVFSENNFETLCQSGVKLESYSGALAARFIIDLKFSDSPIIELYPAENFYLNKKYGKIYEIVFVDTYNNNNEQYTLHSVYGRGYIKYKLFKKETEIALSSIPETADLSDIYILDNNGKPIKTILAAYKENKPGAESDYSNLISIFDNIDAIASYRASYFRYGSKIKMILSEDQIEKDADGNVIIPRQLKVLDYLILKDSNPADTQQTRETQIPNLSQQAFDDAIRSLQGEACDRAGISRTAFGIETAGRNASAEALEIRESASYKTRAAKIKLWEEFIADLMKLSLIYSAVMNSPVVDGVVTLNNEFKYTYSVEFSPFNEESDLDKAERIARIKELGFYTDEDAIREFYDDKLNEADIEEKIKTLVINTPTNSPNKDENDKNLIDLDKMD